jgi:hypothetical protein
VTTSIPLGRIFGIRIGINWSWLVVFALIAWTLASGIFPDTNPGLRHGTYVSMAIVASILFFASLLLLDGHRAAGAQPAGADGQQPPVRLEAVLLSTDGVARLGGEIRGLRRVRSPQVGEIRHDEIDWAGDGIEQVRWQTMMRSVDVGTGMGRWLSRSPPLRHGRCCGPPTRAATRSP